jgi:hypothetical protein
MLLTSGCNFYRTYGTHYKVPYPQSTDHEHHSVHTVAAPLLVLPYKQKCTIYVTQIMHIVTINISINQCP